MKNSTNAGGLPRANQPLTYCSAPRRFKALFLSIAAILFFLLAAAAHATERPLVLALGDSLTAGYGLPPGQSFPAQLEAALRAEGVNAKVINGGVSGDTSAGGLARLEWLLSDEPDLVIVELGANDGLRGLDPANTRENIDRIITRIRETGARVVLAGMVAPPNLGREYVDRFNSIYPDLAEKHGTSLYPFFLDGVAMDPALNQDDGIHPTAEGVGVIVDGILPFVIDDLAKTSE